MLMSRVLTALALTFGTYSAEAAGTIHFRDGRQVQADDWWDTGGVFYYVTRGMGQQADTSSNIARIQGEPKWARPYWTNARILFKDGSFADANFLVIAPQELRTIERNTAITTITTAWPPQCGRPRSPDSRDGARLRCHDYYKEGTGADRGDGRLHVRPQRRGVHVREQQAATVPRAPPPGVGRLQTRRHGHGQGLLCRLNYHLDTE
jgi:hypothetical protein